METISVHVRNFGSFGTQNVSAVPASAASGRQEFGPRGLAALFIICLIIVLRYILDQQYKNLPNQDA